MKMQILAAIGEKELQPVTLLNSALAADDRLKFGFSLLQMALSHAEHPDQPPTSLKQERIACGIDDPQLDSAVAGARMIGKSGRFIETFLTDSWLDHLRQHQRVTKADRIVEQVVRRFQVGDGPKTTHLIGAQPRRQRSSAGT